MVRVNESANIGLSIIKVVAKSRYWYFLKKVNKVKKGTGEIVGINEVGSVCGDIRDEDQLT
jgi:hypothetical protein